MLELWGVQILVFPLTLHIAYATACCYRTSHDVQSAIIRKCTYVPLQKLYVKYTKNRYYLATENIFTFLNVAIIN